MCVSSTQIVVERRSVARIRLSFEKTVRYTGGSGGKGTCAENVAAIREVRRGSQVEEFGRSLWKVEMRIRLEFGNNIVWICTQIRENPLRIHTEFTPRLKRIRSEVCCKFWPLLLSDFGPNT